MVREGADRDRPATFLFLQGIASPFFSDLGRALRARGHGVRRINFCSGDWLFWGGGSDHYRGPRTGWEAYLDAYVAEHGLELSRTPDDPATHHFNVYLNDPSTVPEADLRTQVFVPVR